MATSIRASQLSEENRRAMLSFGFSRSVTFESPHAKHGTEGASYFVMKTPMGVSAKRQRLRLFARFALILLGVVAILANRMAVLIDFDHVDVLLFAERHQLVRAS